MSTKKQILKKIKDIKAAESHYSTNEMWIDDDGNKYYIDRAPIDWDKALGRKQNGKINEK